MYENVQILTPIHHSLLQLKPCNSFEFASALTMIPLAMFEIEEASKYYPVVFSNDEAPVPVAVVGFADKNLYVNDQGQWLAPYVPARVRTYPFAMVTTSKADQYVVAIDANAPHFVEQDAQSLFDADGKTTPWLNQFIQYLMGLQKEYQVAQAVAGVLKKAGLITERRVDITLKNGNNKSFQGFLCVDDDALNALSEERKKEMESNGKMALLIAHRASLVHFDKFFS